jgi:hypothetical protein
MQHGADLLVHIVLIAQTSLSAVHQGATIATTGANRFPKNPGTLESRGLLVPALILFNAYLY